jgi:hypothetical protein
MPDEAGLIGAVFPVKPRRLKQLVVAAITEVVVQMCLTRYH